MALIQYSAIESIPIRDAIHTIVSCDKIVYGKATLADLLIAGDINSLPLAGFNSIANFGRGMYVFFDGSAPVYVGQTGNFLERFCGHGNTKPKPNYGWNSLLDKICRKRLLFTNNPLTEVNLSEALQLLNTFSFVRVNTSNRPDINPEKLERVFLRAFKKLYGESLMNGNIGGIDADYLNRSVRTILSERP